MSDGVEPEGRRVRVVKAALFVAVIALCALLARGLDLARVREAMARADWRLVALAAALNLTVISAARVGRWAALLETLPVAPPGPRFGALTVVYFASQAVSNLLPARAGEALRVAQLHRRHGYPVAALVAFELAETIVGAVTLGGIALVLLFHPDTPASLRGAMVPFVVIGPGGALALYWLGGRPVATGASAARTGLVGKAVGVLQRLAAAMRRLRSTRAWARSLAWSLLSDLTDAVMIGLVLSAVGVSLPPLAWAVTLVAINVALVVPLTPAQVGVLEVGAVACVRLLGVDEAPAVAFAVLYHAAHVIPPTLVGALATPFLDLRSAGGAPPD